MGDLVGYYLSSLSYTRISHFTSGQTQGNTTILWNALFRNIQFGHDFNPRDQKRRKFTARLDNFTELAIDP